MRSLIVAGTVFFEIDGHPSALNLTLYACVLVLDAAFWTTALNSQWLITLMTRHKWIGVVIPMGLLVAWGDLSVNPYNGFSTKQIAMWFFVCGLFPFVIYVGAPKEAKLKWPYHTLQIFAFFVVFPSYIYPHISNKWGGGHPAEVTVTFSKDSAVMASKTERYQLVAQDDSGIYILATGAKRATFIPRSGIGAITFSQDQADIPH